MSHPVKFLHYACGHSTPVRGGSEAHVTRMCPACALGTGTEWRWFIRRDPVSLSDLLGNPPKAPHPGPYCDCDMCQSRIP